jgi:hypothetical protein
LELDLVGVPFRGFSEARELPMKELTMDGERAVVIDVSKALYEAAERLPSGSPWIDAFCGIAQLIEGETGPRTVTASERLRRRGIQARARLRDAGRPTARTGC